MEQHNEYEIDLATLFRIIFRKWYLIVGITVLGLILSVFYAYGMLDNEYTTNTSMIVLVENEAQTVEQNFNFSQRLTKTYTELAKSDLVLNKVKDNLDLDISNNALRDMMTISGVDQTPIIKLQVVYSEPLLAQQIANETVKVMQEASFIFEGFDKIELLDVATFPNIPSGPNRVLYLMIGTILGGILGVGLVLLMEFLDKSIKTPSDIEDRLGLRMLSIIPYYEMEGDIKNEF